VPHITTPVLTIGRLAKAANVNIETIRYYQRQALIIEPKKPLTGFRCYPKTDISLIKFIKRAQCLGFSLKEIKQLILLGEQHCDDVQQLAREKREKIAEQISGLVQIQSALDELIAKCHQEEDHCGFIEALTQQGFMQN
jgi:MerR family mercuric resistance operon transcriptional regulator